MNTNLLVTASALSDQDLLTRLERLAGNEREASAELVAHLAALDSRAVLYAAQGYGSLFSYCTQALRLSEDAACNRIEAARACRRFPLILELLASPTALPATPRPIVQASAPERYRVQFTIGQETHEKLRRLQALLRREIPDGDPGAIFDRALTVLLERVEKTRLAATAKPRPNPPIRPETDPSSPIRPRTDREVSTPGVPPGHVTPAPQSRDVPPAPQSRHVPREVCWRHNQHEAELIFGPHGPSIVRNAHPSP